MESKTPINLAELRQLIDEGKQIIILDVRNEKKYLVK
jgi:hypothetical protein